MSLQKDAGYVMLSMATRWKVVAYMVHEEICVTHKAIPSFYRSKVKITQFITGAISLICLLNKKYKQLNVDAITQENLTQIINVLNDNNDMNLTQINK